MIRVLTILLLVPLIMVLAPPCRAAGNGEVTVSLVDIPAELQERSVLVTLGNGPNDTDAVLVVLNGLNRYGQAVTLPEGIYYCNAAVQYDALNDWPLREVDGTTFLQVEAGGQYELNTDDSASFHLTVTDTKNPDAELCTPSRDENATVQRAAAYNAPATAAPSATPTPEPTSSQPVQQSKKPANPFWNVLDFLPIVFIGAGLFWFRQKSRRGGPKG